MTDLELLEEHDGCKIDYTLFSVADAIKELRGVQRQKIFEKMQRFRIEAKLDVVMYQIIFELFD